LFFDGTDSFINGRKHLVSFLNLLGLKPVPQLGTLLGCQPFDRFLDFDQTAHIKNHFAESFGSVSQSPRSLKIGKYRAQVPNNEEVVTNLDAIFCSSLPFRIVGNVVHKLVGTQEARKEYAEALQM
jgi:hypothetical protein